MENIKQLLRRKFLLFLFIFLIADIIFLGLYFFFSLKIYPNKSITNPTKETQPTTAPIIKRLSSMATNSAFLQLEGDLNDLEKMTAEVDLTEPKLAPTVIELNVSFEK